MEIICNDEKLVSELQLVYNLFYNNITGDTDNKSIVIDKIQLDYNIKKNKIYVIVTLYTDKKNYSFKSNYILESDDYKYIRRYTKLSLYNSLESVFKLRLPWGSITGIRPTKLYYELLDTYVDTNVVSELLNHTFKLTPRKIKILE